jgi:hypothetical protein
MPKNDRRHPAAQGKFGKSFATGCFSADSISMNTLRNLLCAPLVFLLASCPGTLPGVGILAPASVANHQMDYSDLNGIHNYRFLENGTYRVRTTLPQGGTRPERRGKWEWERKSPGDAVLKLDGNKTISLDFTTREHANGTIQGDKRIYPFHFRELN